MLRLVHFLCSQGRDSGKYKVTEVKRKMDDADEDSTSVLYRMIAANHARENIDAAGQETNKAQAKITGSILCL